MLPSLSYEFASSIGLTCDDDALVRRIAAAYNTAHSTFSESSRSFWESDYAALKRSVHEDLISGDGERLASTLRNPAQSPLFFGFDSPTSLQPWPDTKAVETEMAEALYGRLLRIAQAFGVARLPDPQFLRSEGHLNVEFILNLLDEAVGFRVVFPNPFPAENGIATTRGVCSYRALQGLFQAWQISRLLGGERHAHVLEIGAGLGRTAYFARLFGVERYTIVDIALSNVAQAYFLGRVLGQDAISLYGEHDKAAIDIIPYGEFFNRTDCFDLVVNVDSLPEMDELIAGRYVDAISSRSKRFLSINHEHRSFSVREIFARREHYASRRNLYWLRDGYVEEIFEFMHT